jgi:hypothetical protein
MVAYFSNTLGLRDGRPHNDGEPDIEKAVIGNAGRRSQCSTKANNSIASLALQYFSGRVLGRALGAPHHGERDREERPAFRDLGEQRNE